MGMAARAAPSHLAGVTLAGLAVAAYAALVALGMRALLATRSHGIEITWLAGLLVAATGVQATIPMGAPEGYDLTSGRP